jgi:hypothetical protein
MNTVAWIYTLGVAARIRGLQSVKSSGTLVWMRGLRSRRYILFLVLVVWVSYEGDQACVESVQATHVKRNVLLFIVLKLTTKWKRCKLFSRFSAGTIIQELRVRRLPPRKYLSSLVDRLIKPLVRCWMIRSSCFGGSQGLQSYIINPSVTRGLIGWS